MQLTTAACLYFLGTNARTAQCYHGNMYLNEYVWIPKFQELQKVASGMALHEVAPNSLFHPVQPDTQRLSVLARRALIQRGEFLSGKAYTLPDASPHWARVHKTAHSLNRIAGSCYAGRGPKARYESTSESKSEISERLLAIS